jgi:hypothetical protein
MKIETPEHEPLVLGIEGSQPQCGVMHESVPFHE